MKLIIILFLFAVNNILFGQEIHDTLVLPEDFLFTAGFEEEYFKSPEKSENLLYLKVFLASSGKLSEAEIEQAANRYREFITKLNTDKINSYNLYKRIKIIYKTVHEEFLKKYELQSSFDKIFQDGMYNCVSASALYGLVLNDLNIPFVIIETPAHVYLVANPEKDNIKIETTDPQGGYLVMDQKSKKSFVDYMHNQKLIADNEFMSTSTDDLYNKYYYADTKIQMKELLALHYLNLAVENLTKRNHENSYAFLEKSYFLYPAERTRFLMLITIADIIKNKNYDNKDDLKYLVKISRFKSPGVTTSDIVNEFARITNQQLINNSNLKYYDEIYAYLDSNLRNSEIRDEISFIYFYERGRFLLNKGQPKESHEWFAKAYKLKPRNADAQNAFVQSLAVTFHQLTGTEVLEKMEEYYFQNDDLKQNKTFVGLLLHAYLMSAYEHFGRLQAIIAEKELEKFEQLYSQNRELDIFQDAIADAYSGASVYHFRKGNYKKARTYIEQGLIFAPGNFRLMMSLQSF